MISKLFSFPKQQAQLELDMFKILFVLLKCKEAQDKVLSEE